MFLNFHVVFECIVMRFGCIFESFDIFMLLPSHGLNAELKENSWPISALILEFLFLRRILISNFKCRGLVSLLMLMFSP